MNPYEIEIAVEVIIDNNCKEVPYEGTDVDKISLKEDMIDLINKLIQ